ncbi:type II toxin-antitoxin system PemK/MazF family toxin [Candidatus Atribacteria bacterium 1244-E10-H5-B2]|nr:MAG: type II toxin-antitoxin system PemK/MazF family toxin [Candidatus Atribacteria bacterium 1244-E10-H5-B2]
MSLPYRGEVFWGPGKKKIRPLLVVSNDQGNRYSNDVVVIPGTTQKIDIVYPVEVLVTEGLSKPTKFQADSIFTIEKEELGEKITELSPDIMAEVNTTLQIELNLE